MESANAQTLAIGGSSAGVLTGVAVTADRRRKARAQARALGGAPLPVLAPAERDALLAASHDAIIGAEAPRPWQIHRRDVPGFLADSAESRTWVHSTSDEAQRAIVGTGVDVRRGAGFLGQGFYTGTGETPTYGRAHVPVAIRTDRPLQVRDAHYGRFQDSITPITDAWKAANVELAARSSPGEVARRALLDAGYDAISYIHPSGERFEWLVGLDPDKVRVIVREGPVDVGDLVKSGAYTLERELGGSTGAYLVRRAQDGARFVFKPGASPAHRAEEIVANEAYRAMGVPAPATQVEELAGGPVALSQYIDGRPLSQLSGEARLQATDRLARAFALDAVLGNWDGTLNDNVRVLDDGTPFRVDNGGALRFRARGEAKGRAFDRRVDELRTMRSDNYPASRTFGALSDGDVARQVLHGLEPRRSQLMQALPEHLREVVGHRVDFVVQWARRIR